MARMIPFLFDQAKTTSGERRTFNALTALDDQYVVLHSLSLPEHVRQKQGEADFVIIGPEGILCLEVKGGSVLHHDGFWTFVDWQGRSYTKTKSPWDQAMDNAMSIRRRFSALPDVPEALRRCVYATGVVFPDVKLETESVGDSSIIAEVLLDQRRNLSEMAGFVSRCYNFWGSKLRGSERSTVPLLRSAEINRARQLLRGDFEVVPCLDMWVDEAEEGIKAATEEEKLRYLDQVWDHERVLLTGPAGTGKTILSLAYASRRAGQGDRVLYTCFNRNLRDVLIRRSTDSRVRYASFLDYMENELNQLGRLVSAPQDTAPLADRDRYYDHDLPDAFCELALTDPRVAKYDCLVVDEGQDLIAPSYLDCMDLILVGGLRRGRWHMCYDPNQNIYNVDGFDSGLRRLREETTYWDFPLVVNCRNTHAIAAYNAEVTRTKLPRISKVHGRRVEAIPYTGYPQERELLRGLLKMLTIEQGIRPSEIFLLSLTGFAKSCLQGEPQALGVDLPITDMTRFNLDLIAQETVKFCTAQGFKGLEAPVVILLDLERLDRANLLYTALSRAKSVLYVFYDERLKDQHDPILSEYAKRLRDVPRLPVSHPLSGQYSVT